MKKIVLLISVLSLLNCKTKVNQSKMDNKAYTLIAKGNLYGAGDEGIEKQNMVITNSEDWKALLIQMDTINKVSESFAETEIDFNEFQVIAVFDDVKNTGGHYLDLNIEEDKEQISIEVLQTAPEGMATMVMTQPFYIVKVLKDERPIVFK